MPVLCANRAHGWPPHVYHESVATVRACCQGEAVAPLTRDGRSVQPRASEGRLRRRGGAYRAAVDAAWQAYVIEQGFFDGDIDVARAEKVRFYRRFWIRRRDINLEGNLW